MNLDEFYETMKDALHFFGVKWGHKHLINVEIKEDKVILSYEGKSIIITSKKEN